jgi:hypothetical protein
MLNVLLFTTNDLDIPAFTVLLQRNWYTCILFANKFTTEKASSFWCNRLLHEKWETPSSSVRHTLMCTLTFASAQLSLHLLVFSFPP